MNGFDIEPQDIIHIKRELFQRFHLNVLCSEVWWFKKYQEKNGASVVSYTNQSSVLVWYSGFSVVLSVVYIENNMFDFSRRQLMYLIERLKFKWIVLTLT